MSQLYSLNRLIREDNKVIGKTTLFAYDNAGNITERCEYAYTSKSGEELSELECTHYSYDYEGDRLKSYNGEAFEYNDLGCPTTYRGESVTWQYGKMLASYKGVTFTYNGNGSRASKGGITFTYDSDGRLIKQSNGLEFIYDNAGVAGVKYGGAQYFYRRDAQGNIIAILDRNGSAVVYYEYDAWGNVATTDNNGNDVESGIGFLNPFRYRGYYYDTETELYYLQTRYYDPELGRFISQDSLEYADPETINGLNLFAYCGNNPVMFTDPNGNTRWWEWLFAGLIVVASAVLAVVTGGTLLVLSAALMGAAIGGGISLISQGINYAVNGVDFSWGQFALDWGVGAITGAIGASGISMIGSTIVGAAIGGVANIGSQLISGKSFSEINWLSVGISALVGGVAGALGGAGAKNRAGLNNAINGDAAVIKAQNSVAKVGNKLANGLYATARGAKSAYTQVMNRMSNAIFNAAHKYAVNSIIKVLGFYAASSALLSGLSFIFNW